MKQRVSAARIIRGFAKQIQREFIVTAVMAIKICTYGLLLDFLASGCIFCVVRLNGARPPEPTDIPLRA